MIKQRLYVGDTRGLKLRIVEYSLNINLLVELLLCFFVLQDSVLKEYPVTQCLVTKNTMTFFATFNS